MKGYFIKVYHRIYCYYAPSILIFEANDDKGRERAKSQAKERSGLGRFKDWMFI